VRIPKIHRELINRFEPCPCKLPRETIVTKKDIYHTLAFSAWQPCSHQCIHGRNVWFNNNRSARDDDNHTLNGSTDIVDDIWTRFHHCKCCAVPGCLGIRRLTNYNNGIFKVIGFNKLVVRVVTKDYFCAWINCWFYGTENSCSCPRKKKY